MIPIRQSIEVDAPVGDVAAQWPQFIEWALVGPSRLACNELVCVDPARSALVRFEERASGHACVEVELEVPHAQVPGNGDGSRDEIEDKLRHDLLLFKEYVENDRSASRSGALEAATSSVRTEKRRGLFHRSAADDDPGESARPSNHAR
jgi:hypothetical protein